jgi:hypothetical protein
VKRVNRGPSDADVARATAQFFKELK